MGRQFKIHPYGEEKKTVKGGNKMEMFDFGTFRFGVAICHDVVFPEVSRALARKGAEMLFFPSRIRKEGIEPWHMYVQVRALENRIPAVAPNACSRIFGGKSIAVDFSYDRKSNIALPKQALASVNEQILVMDIDLEHVKIMRQKRLEDLKDDLYSSL
jgi:predicted amidohydrolase